MSRLSIEEFRQEYSHAPIDTNRIVSAILRHLSTDEPLFEAAGRLHDAQQEFDVELDNSGVELG